MRELHVEEEQMGPEEEDEQLRLEKEEMVGAE